MIARDSRNIPAWQQVQLIVPDLCADQHTPLQLGPQQLPAPVRSQIGGRVPLDEPIKRMVADDQLLRHGELA
ncbi:MAG TPA: hypothetical protein VL549_09670 [Gemmatimonadales bacterium]|nr:hypothetical protein [Gemmatimonadales bacterium]